MKRRMRQKSKKAALKRALEIVNQAPKDSNEAEIIEMIKKETEKEIQLAIKNFFEKETLKKSKKLA